MILTRPGRRSHQLPDRQLVASTGFKRPQCLGRVVNLIRVDDAIMVRIQRPDYRRQRRRRSTVSALVALLSPRGTVSWTLAKRGTHAA